MHSIAKKLMRYAKGAISSIGQLEPRDFLRVISDSDEVIKRIKKYNFSIVLNIHDKVIGFPILLKSSYEENVTKVFLEHLKSDTHFLDIGANIGYYSLLAASQCPQGKIISFEPDEKNFRLLQTSVFFNGFDSIIHPYRLAVSDKAESVIIYAVNQSANSGAKVTSKDIESLNPYIHSSNPDFHKVEAVQLDSFLEGQRIDIIKIDIEGHEPFAIRGMTKLLIQNKPTIFIELAPISLNYIAKTSPEAFLQFFIDLEYFLNVIDQDGNLIDCQQNISAVTDYFQKCGTNHIDLLLKPKE